MSRKSVRNLAVCCLVAGVLFVALLCWRASKAPIFQPRKPPAPPAVITATQTPPASRHSTIKVPTAPEMEAAHANEVKREQAVVAALIMTPITFYGKVVDEQANPVQGARVKMTAADLAYGVGSANERQSDTHGSFSISGIHGVALLVEVSKDGYYSLPQSWGNFGYAMQAGDEQPPHTDPSTPATFILRKMGEVEKLIVQKRYIKTGGTGAPVFVDLHTGETLASSLGAIQVQTWTDDRSTAAAGGRHYDWRYVITVPGGGIQQRTGDEFDFTAPADGYQSTDTVEFQASNPRWTSRTAREYYVKLADGEYARFIFAMYTGANNFFEITSYLNPTPSHRNLEYGPPQ